MDNRHELARILLGKAADDLTMARRLAGDEASPKWGIGFHIQQAVEKGIKCVLSARGIEYPRTHNIALLLDLLSENSIASPAEHDSLVFLTPFGVLFRYDEMGPTDKELANLPNQDSMLRLADLVVAWAKAFTSAD